jgi:TonB family protein
MLMDENPVVRKRPWGMIASGVLHVVALALLLYRPEPIVVTLQSIQLGDSSKAYHAVYVAPDTSSDEAQPVEHNKLAFKTVHHKRHAKPSPVKPEEAPTPDQQAEVAAVNKKVGVPYGSLWALMAEGHDVKPAFPVEYPSPNLSGIDLPLGYQGDVVIEVTIDRDGSVVDMQVLKSIGHGIDEKCVAAVQRWRFRPAILDGTPIASKHDVHFHFPS